MKKTAFFLIGTVLFVLFLGTCGMGPAVTEGVDGNEYVDYVETFMPDGSSQITLYLDGRKVPRSLSQRALSKNLAVMSHDFFEVVFYWSNGSDTAISRTSWEIGQAAGISGLYRPSPGINYGSSNYPASGTGAAAIIMVGKKDKTLLGVGNLIKVNEVVTGLVTPDTTSITFEVKALISNVNDPVNDFQTAVKHTNIDLPANVSASVTDISKNPLGDSGTEYPLFFLPLNKTAIAAKYFIRGGIVDNGGGVIALADKFRFIPRDPRFFDGARTWYVSGNYDAVAAFNTVVTAQFTADEPIFGIPLTETELEINLTFNTVSNGGLFSFYLELPVYGLDKTPANTVGVNGPSPTIWYIRTGYGQNLVNLDRGVDGSGCVFIGVDVRDIDWIDIFTEGPN